MRWGHETPADFWRALAVLLLLCAAGYALTIAAVGYFPVVTR